MDPVYLDPLTDYGFKRLFGTEASKPTLMAFLQAVLPDLPPLRDLTYVNVEQPPPGEGGRGSRLDVLCTGVDAEIYHAEVQRAPQVNYKDRSVYYPSLLLQRQGERGTWDHALAPVYSISILDFAMPPYPGQDPTRYLTVAKLRDQSGAVYYDKLTLVAIELPRFRKTEPELTTELDRWLYLLRHAAELRTCPAAFQEKTYQNFFAMAELAKFTNDERWAYEMSLKAERDARGQIEYARQVGAERREAHVRRENAAMALREGLSITLSAKVSGLSVEEVRALARELGIAAPEA